MALNGMKVASRGSGAPGHDGGLDAFIHTIEVWNGPREPLNEDRGSNYLKGPRRPKQSKGPVIGRVGDKVLRWDDT
ncbi:MAG: hypothetical protein M1829_005125 [Trizodia sp. TS-e1964]|nr:MAG: hypothetical protein M1829_005125 [Trizodia sp. TS-e1964]